MFSATQCCEYVVLTPDGYWATFSERRAAENHARNRSGGSTAEVRAVVWEQGRVPCPRTHVVFVDGSRQSSPGRIGGPIE